MARREQQTGMAALLSIVAAIASFFTGAVAGLFLALAAVLLGLFGFIRAASPRVSGGILSLFAVVLGVVGVVASVFKAVF